MSEEWSPYVIRLYKLAMLAGIDSMTKAEVQHMWLQIFKIIWRKRLCGEIQTLKMNMWKLWSTVWIISRLRQREQWGTEQPIWCQEVMGWAECWRWNWGESKRSFPKGWEGYLDYSTLGVFCYRDDHCITDMLCDLCQRKDHVARMCRDTGRVVLGLIGGQ